MITTLKHLTPTAIVWWMFGASLAMYVMFAIDKKAFDARRH